MRFHIAKHILKGETSIPCGLVHKGNVRKISTICKKYKPLNNFNIFNNLGLQHQKVTLRVTEQNFANSVMTLHVPMYTTPKGRL